jgi:hypothetical protein
MLCYIPKMIDVFWYHASFPDFIFDPARSNFRMLVRIGLSFHVMKLPTTIFSVNLASISWKLVCDSTWAI